MPPNNNDLGSNPLGGIERAIDALTRATNARTKSVDANGWTIYDFGVFKLYYKSGFTATIAGGGYGGTTTSALPVGTTTSSVLPFAYTLQGGVGQMIHDLSFPTSTTVQMVLHSTAGVALSVNGSVALISV